MDKYRRRAVSVEDAREAVMNQVHPLRTIEIGLMESIGRRLAEEVRTGEPIPHFRRAGMDGYAVRFEDIAHASPSEPVLLEVIEHIPCGKVPSRTIRSGTASRIMTGAMVPDGADAVIMLEMTEDTTRDGRPYVMIRKPDPRGTNITPIGKEAERGLLVLRKGQLIGAGQAAILAALGHSRVRVFRKPKVAVLSTGTELLPVSVPLQMGKIRNSNVYMLSAQILSAGGEPLIVDQIPDDASQVERKIYELLASDVDLIVTTGGVSVGDYDIMADFFTKWSGTTLFNKIAMRPGSPTTAGVWRDKLIFGLSGNPSACFVGFELFVRPVLLSMQESADESSLVFTALLAEDYLKVNAYTRYVRGRWYNREGIVYVSVAGSGQSSELLSIQNVNCLIVIPPTKTGCKAGELVNVIPLEGTIIP